MYGEASYKFPSDSSRRSSVSVRISSPSLSIMRTLSLHKHASTERCMIKELMAICN